jgi:hypothetical protein
VFSFIPSSWRANTFRRLQMKIVLLGAALIAPATLVSPASAQQVITNPGYCAQFKLSTTPRPSREEEANRMAEEYA